MSTIADSAEWKDLEAHAAEVKATLHLRDLLADGDRSAALTAEAEGVLLDYSRQNATTATKAKLVALARAAGLEAKVAAMFAGEKINATEGRAALHVALRAPKGSVVAVDGVDQVPAVHAVLDAILVGRGRACAG